MKFITEKTSETGKKFAAILKKAKECKKQSDELAKSFGTETYRQSNWSVWGGISSFIFERNPGKNWRKSVNKQRNEYFPSRATKEGKIMIEKIENLLKVDYEELNDCVGFDGSYFKTIGFIGSGSKKYFGFSLKDDSIFTPPVDCKEVTTTEFNKIFKNKK